jgi:hypothetical protein
MRAIMRTARAGWAPEAVSPESMVASAPSKMAVATSLASARVGRELDTIECNISVATMAVRRCSAAAASTLRCNTGTCSGGNSTPRSPRATITASLASTMASSRSMACGVSIFEQMGSTRPQASQISRTSFTSSGLRTKDTAT